MDFRTAVTILGRQITTAEIAEAAGMSPSSIRQARLQEGAPGYRTPPKHWEEALLQLAKQRQLELASLMKDLERALESKQR
jgi:AcrR family transcriptional regulator